MFRVSIVGAMWLFAAATFAQDRAGAHDQVLLLDDGVLRPELCGALRIQLTGVASVVCSTRDGARALDVRIDEAAGEVRQQQARLAVLLERDPDPRLLRMLLIGEREDHALLAIERIEDRPAPDVDRSLALKVRDTLESLRTAGEPRRHEEPLAVGLTQPAPRRDASPLVVRALLEVGGALSLATRTRGAGLVWLGARLAQRGRYGEVLVGAERASEIHARGSAGRVEQNEWGIGMEARAGRQWPRFALGVVGGLSVLRMNAEGSTTTGARGSETFTQLRLGLGLDARVIVLDGPTRVSVRLAPMLRLDPTEHRFALDEQTTLSLGRAQLWLPLTLLLELPLRREGPDDET